MSRDVLGTKFSLGICTNVPKNNRRSRPINTPSFWEKWTYFPQIPNGHPTPAHDLLSTTAHAQTLKTQVSSHIFFFGMISLCHGFSKVSPERTGIHGTCSYSTAIRSWGATLPMWSSRKRLRRWQQSEETRLCPSSPADPPPPNPAPAPMIGVKDILMNDRVHFRAPCAVQTTGVAHLMGLQDSPVYHSLHVAGGGRGGVGRGVQKINQCQCLFLFEANKVHGVWACPTEHHFVRSQSCPRWPNTPPPTPPPLLVFLVSPWFLVTSVFLLDFVGLAFCS